MFLGTRAAKRQNKRDTPTETGAQTRSHSCRGETRTELRLLEERGVDIPARGTCVDHYGVRDRSAFDHVSNMDGMLTTLNAAEKVITL